MDNLADLRICVEKSAVPMVSGNGGLQAPNLTAAFYKQKLWPQNSTVKIQFLSNPPVVGEGVSSSSLLWTPKATQAKLVRSDGSHPKPDPLENVVRSLTPVEAVKKIVMERIQPLVNLKFVFVDKGGDVRIGFLPGKGAWSLLGTDCKMQAGQTMNFGWLDCATIIHEFGHVLGLIHEHQNPNGKGIEWDAEKVYSWAAQTQGWDKQTTYTNILNKYDVNQINGSSFDPDSIMLYFFPATLTLNNVGTDPNSMLSKTDVEWITKTYPPSGDKIPDVPTSSSKSPESSESSPSSDKWFVPDFTNFNGMAIFLLSLIIATLIFISYRVYTKINKKRRRKSPSRKKHWYNIF